MFSRLFTRFAPCIQLLPHTKLSHRLTFKMPRLSIRSVPGEERMQISFIFSAEGQPGCSGGGKERVFNFDRLQTEELGKTLVRINANVSKVVNKKTKKKNRSPTEVVNVSPETEGGALGLAAELYNERGRGKIDESLQNKDAWKEGMELVVCNTRYNVQMNPPCIRSILLPEVVMVGFPIYPKIDAEFIDLASCNVTWYKEEKSDAGDVTPSSGSATDLTRELPKSQSELTNRDWKVGTPVQSGEVVKASTSEMTDLTSQAGAGGDVTRGSTSQTPSPSLAAKVPKKQKRKLNGSMSNLNWTEVQAARKYPEGIAELQVHRDIVYTPVAGDVGHKLRIVCTPSDGVRSGDDVDMVSADVTSGPGRCPFENRHALTKERVEPGSFRVVSYNILADLYADSDFSRDYLYPYCPPYALHADYRKQILTKELVGYNADLICLQEVDRRLFNHDLHSTLELQGMSGRLKLKYGEVAEGEAIFWRNDKFKCIGESDLHLGEALQKDPAYEALYEKVCTKEGLKAKVLDRKTILQTCTLQSLEDPARLVVVATTHLYFHPRAGHVRLVQAAVCMHHITSIVSTLQKEHGKRPSVVFCGDFNSTPNHGVYEFITKGYLPANNADWFAVGREEYVANLELRHPLRMTCASGTPQYTNFVAGFADCLDYIFVSCDSLRTCRTIPLPSHQEVTAHTALPNQFYPSDHLALVCDLSWL